MSADLAALVLGPAEAVLAAATRCDDCHAEPGEPCHPWCLGVAALLDAATPEPEPTPVGLRPEYPTRACRTITYTVWDAGTKLATLWKGPRGWTVHVTGHGVSLCEPVHPSAEVALAYHGWVAR